MPRVNFHLIPKYKIRSTVIISSYSLVWSFLKCRGVPCTITVHLHVVNSTIVLVPFYCNHQFKCLHLRLGLWLYWAIVQTHFRRYEKIIVVVVVIIIIIIIIIVIIYSYYYYCHYYYYYLFSWFFCCCCNRLSWRKVVSHACTLISRSLSSLSWMHTFNAIRNVLNTRCS